jgi:hypothetical protein
MAFPKSPYITRLRKERDYWRDRAVISERELKIAAKCVRALLQVRKAGEKWLQDLDVSWGPR